MVELAGAVCDEEGDSAASGGPRIKGYHDVFFFQAEDGIRDKLVTGVQTCALPIYHYLDLPYDLSKVLFICTANQLETIPSPLLDRMDVISLSGYTDDEKFGIARKYLVPKQVEAHGLDPAQVSITDNALRLVAREYTREAGVRNLERRIADLCRKAAREVAEGRKTKIRIDEKRVRKWLGPRRVSGEGRERASGPR